MSDREFMIVWNLSTWTVTILMVALAAYTVVGGTLSFIYHQARGLRRLYTELKPTTPKLHSYTQALIENRAPELGDLKRFAAVGDWQQFNETLDGIVYTLGTQEANVSVRAALIAQFDSARMSAPLAE